MKLFIFYAADSLSLASIHILYTCVYSRFIQFIFAKAIVIPLQELDAFGNRQLTAFYDTQQKKGLNSNVMALARC